MTEPSGDQGLVAADVDSISPADLAGLAIPDSRLERALHWVPRVLASKPHVLFLIGLGIYLVVLPLLGFAVSAKAELIGGNYTNVTGDVGASIAAGGTLHLIRQGHKRRRREEERLRLTREMHALLQRVHPAAAAELGQRPADG